MMRIILIGKRSDQRIAHALEKAFGDRVSFVRIGDNQIVAPSGDNDFILLQSRSLSKIDARNSMIIFSDVPNLKSRFACCDDAVAIVDSGNREIVDFICRHQIKAIPCGLSSYDTITLSSITADSAVVSVLREITSFGGSVIEPFEIPVRLTEQTDRYVILAVCAVLLLSDRQDLLENFVI